MLPESQCESTLIVWATCGNLPAKSWLTFLRSLSFLLENHQKYPVWNINVENWLVIFWLYKSLTDSFWAMRLKTRANHLLSEDWELYVKGFNLVCQNTRLQITKIQMFSICEIARFYGLGNQRLDSQMMHVIQSREVHPPFLRMHHCCHQDQRWNFFRCAICFLTRSIRCVVSSKTIEFVSELSKLCTAAFPVLQRDSHTERLLGFMLILYYNWIIFRSEWHFAEKLTQSSCHNTNLLIQ